ncbi:MAG: phosphoribosylamine--glycine ligase [Nitrososphaera sp.]|nr:phosphoribosylamine--glycine ligase [Nitrososphaera sp.]
MSSGKGSEVLIVGSGGREHALGWKIAQSLRVKRIFFAPGNGGTFENVDIRPNDIEKLAEFAKTRDNLLTIVGPEEPLSLGIVDLFVKEGLRIFGPTREAAKLEASKAFAKQLMQEARIPTAPFAVFTDPEKAKDYIARQNTALVVKADGLAAGKGVIVCENAEQAIAAVDRVMVKREFGVAGERVVVEERLSGEEASFIALCDGESMIPLESSQDHKRVFDGDTGPNTGGMGAYSPAPVIDSKLHQQIVKQVMDPAITTMKKRGTPFTGFLYAGIMVEEETHRPRVLEFNARMGDPECQPMMLRMKSDLFEYIDAAVDHRLDSMSPIQWRNETAVCVIMASRGYPGSYEKGKVIEGLDSNMGSDIVVFHAGTTRDSQNRLITNGGRVLGITAAGDDPTDAVEKAYSAVRKIRWGDNEHHYRTDIARRAVIRQV